MQAGSTSVSLPSLTKFKHELETLVTNNVTFKLKFILNEICEEYNLSQSVLFDKYMSDEIILVGSNATKKKTKKVIPTQERCCARTQSGNQCTRKRKDDNKYCGSHTINCPFGTIGDNTSPDADDNVSVSTPVLVPTPAPTLPNKKIIAIRKKTHPDSPTEHSHPVS